MDPIKAAERVLCIPASCFEGAGKFQGFRSFDTPYRDRLLDPTVMCYRPRGEVETDPDFKQLIPYVVLACQGELFHYSRGATGTETRLQALRSVGLGGHIAEEDGNHSSDPYRTGMLRELREEVEIQSNWREEPLGFIFDGRSPVGEVHLGIVHVLELEEPLVWPRESSIADAGFLPLGSLLRNRDQFETWSQFVLEVLSERR